MAVLLRSNTEQQSGIFSEIVIIVVDWIHACCSATCAASPSSTRRPSRCTSYRTRAWSRTPATCAGWRWWRAATSSGTNGSTPARSGTSAASAGSGSPSGEVPRLSAPGPLCGLAGADGSSPQVQHAGAQQDARERGWGASVAAAAAAPPAVSLHLLRGALRAPVRMRTGEPRPPLARSRLSLCAATCWSGTRRPCTGGRWSAPPPRRATPWASCSRLRRRRAPRNPHPRPRPPPPTTTPRRSAAPRRARRVWRTSCSWVSTALGADRPPRPPSRPRSPPACRSVVGAGGQLLVQRIRCRVRAAPRVPALAGRRLPAARPRPAPLHPFPLTRSCSSTATVGPIIISPNDPCTLHGRLRFSAWKYVSEKFLNIKIKHVTGWPKKICAPRAPT